MYTNKHTHLYSVLDLRPLLYLLLRTRLAAWSQVTATSQSRSVENTSIPNTCVRFEAPTVSFAENEIGCLESGDCNQPITFCRKPFNSLIHYYSYAPANTTATIIPGLSVNFNFIVTLEFVLCSHNPNPMDITSFPNCLCVYGFLCLSLVSPCFSLVYGCVFVYVFVPFLIFTPPVYWPKGYCRPLCLSILQYVRPSVSLLLTPSFIFLCFVPLWGFFFSCYPLSISLGI